MTKRLLIIAAILSLNIFSPLLSQDASVVSIIPVFKDGFTAEDQQKFKDTMKDVLAGNAGITVSDTTLDQPDYFKDNLIGREDSLLFNAYTNKQIDYLIVAEYILEEDNNETKIFNKNSEEDGKDVLQHELKKETGVKKKNGDAQQEEIQNEGVQQKSQEGLTHEPERHYSLMLYLYSVKDRAFVYITSNSAILYSELASESALIASRAALFISGTLPLPGLMNITESKNKNELHMEWTPEVSGDSYEVQRSSYPEGPFETIARVEENNFTDVNIVPGMVYYYRLRGYRGDITGDFTETVRAYKRLSHPVSEDIKKILKAKINKMPAAKKIDQQQLDKKYGEIINKFYIKPFYVGFILNILKHYINRYDLAILRGTGDYIIDRTNRTIYLLDNNSYIVKFYSKRLFKLYDIIPESTEPVLLSFGKSGNARGRLIKGWGFEADDHIWNKGDYLELRVPLKKYSTGTEVNFYFAGTRRRDEDSIQRAIVSINGIKLAEFEIGKNGRFRALIPQDFPVDDGEVVMGIELPNAPKINSGAQKNEAYGLAVALNKITLSEYNEERDFFRKLMNNAISFCVLRGEKELVLKDGTRMMLPLYEAMGLATEYYKDLKDWKKYALLFASSDEEIQDKIKQERQKMGR